jgi:hypothetical protein
MEKRNRCRLNAYRRVHRFVDEHATDLGMLRHSLGWMVLEHRRDVMERFDRFERWCARVDAYMASSPSAPRGQVSVAL